MSRALIGVNALREGGEPEREISWPLATDGGKKSDVTDHQLRPEQCRHHQGEATTTTEGNL